MNHGMGRDSESGKVNRPKGPGAGITQPENRVLERTPTLFTGATAGIQGPVCVWTPDRWRLWLRVTLWTTGLLFCLSMILIIHGVPLLPTACCLLMGALAFSDARRPSYITTDDTGIGITTLLGARALHWNDIRSIRRQGSRLVFQAPRTLGVYVSRLPPAIAGQLVPNLMEELEDSTSDQYRWTPRGNLRIDVSGWSQDRRDRLIARVDAAVTPEQRKRLTSWYTEIMTVSLQGYAGARREELIALVVDRAGLRPRRGDPNHFIAPRRRKALQAGFSPSRGLADPSRTAVRLPEELSQTAVHLPDEQVRTAVHLPDEQGRTAVHPPANQSEQPIFDGD